MLKLYFLAVVAGLTCANTRRQAEDYVEYIPGTGLPVILSAPHGGDLQPSHIPNRVAGCWVGGKCDYTHNCGNQDSSRCGIVLTKDMFTQEITRELREILCDLTGGQCPGAIINLLHRRKFDANRDIGEATLGIPEVEDAFYLYHEYIDEEKAKFSDSKALFLDMHGHGHPMVWAELGYLISGNNLNTGNFHQDSTAIRDLAYHVHIPFEVLLRGQRSFGDLLEDQGYTSVPSPTHLGPFGNSYFSGGYLTRRHGSRDGGTIDAIQIESARAHREDSNYPLALAETILDYLQFHYGVNYRK